MADTPDGIELRSICTLLEVFDTRASLAFYRDLLGFEIVESAPSTADVTDDEFGWVWLRSGPLHLMLNSAFDSPADRPVAPDPLRVSVHSDTALYFSTPGVDAMYRWLRAHGVAAEEPADAPYGMRQLYCRDPDGYTVCFQWPIGGMEAKGERLPVATREATAADAARWGDLRTALWPEEDRSELVREAETWFRDGLAGLDAVLLAEHEGEIVGFAELGTRAYAEGCSTSPVAYLEGWYVVPERRGQGVGRQLVEAAIGWARARGLSELASDALYDNAVSRAAHRAIGFEEVEAIRCFRISVSA